MKSNLEKKDPGSEAGVTIQSNAGVTIQSNAGVAIQKRCKTLQQIRTVFN